MDFPVEQVAAAVAGRADTWARLGLVWKTGHDTGPAIGEVESEAWVVHLCVWTSGEAELSTVRLADDRLVNKHYDLAGPADLDALLDELAALVGEDRIPAGAVVGTFPAGP